MYASPEPHDHGMLPVGDGQKADDAIAGRVGRLRGIPGVLVHGRLDLAGPPDTAWHLAQSRPAARLVIVGGVGHAGAEAMNRAVVSATDRFARS